MNLSAGLEADFQGSREYSAGGVGPMFRERRIEEPFSVWEMLSRATQALDKLGINDLVSVFIGDEEIPLEDDDESTESDDVLPEELADAVRNVYGEDDANSFLVMFNYEDKQFSHVITIEAYVDHPYEEAGISVLDRATTVETEEDAAAEEEAAAEQAHRDATMEGAADAYEDEPFDEEGEIYAALEQFMEKLQAALNKELPLQEPALEVWYDEDQEAAGYTPTTGQTSLGGNW